jgi:uncharacterized protein (DUF1778 family)
VRFEHERKSEVTVPRTASDDTQRMNLRVQPEQKAILMRAAPCGTPI